MAQHASYMAGTQYSPADMMQRENDLISPGVITSADLAVTAGSGLAVKVAGAAQGAAGGNAWLPGGYRFFNDASATITLAAADTTNPRIDLIVAAVDTSQTPYAATVKAITGTPAASPAVPTVPSSLAYIPLAQVAVAKSASSISAGNITDLRQIATLNGAMIPQNFAAAPPYAGTTTHSGNAYAISCAGYAYTDGWGLIVKFDADSTGAATLAVNGGAAAPLVDASGNSVSNIKAGMLATVRYNATNSNFQLSGKGGMVHVTAGDTNALYTNTNSESLNPSADYSEIKAVQINNMYGSIRVMFVLASFNSTNVYGRVYINGQAVGTERTTYSSTQFTEDFNVSNGDRVSIYVKSSDGAVFVNALYITVNEAIQYIKVIVA